MSTATAPSRDLPPINPAIGLMFTTADLLIPVFIKAAMGDAALARQMALTAIDDYRPTTRADYVNLARTIAFSLASIALLGHAASPDMTLPEKMRAFDRANALNRSADQSERTMMQRRRYQQANPPVEPPGFRSEPPIPDTQAGEAEIQGAIAEAVKEYLARCTPAPTAAAPAEPQPVLAGYEDAEHPMFPPMAKPAADQPRTTLNREQSLRTRATPEPAGCGWPPSAGMTATPDPIAGQPTKVNRDP